MPHTDTTHGRDREEAQQGRLASATELAAQLFRAPVAALWLVEGGVLNLEHHAGEASDGITFNERARKLALRTLESRGALRTSAAQDAHVYATYLGVPLRLKNGEAAGVLGVFDRAPRVWSDRELTQLQQLAALAELEFALVATETALTNKEAALRALSESSLRTQADALRRAEEQVRLTLDHAPIGMAMVDLDGRFLRVNHALSQMVGYSTEELVTVTFQQITHAEDLSADLALLQRLLAGEITSYQLPKRYQHRNGATVQVLLHVSLVRNRDGQPQHFIAQIEDRTEANQRTAELEHKTTILESVLASMQDAVIVTGQDGRTMLANPAARRMSRHGSLISQQDTADTQLLDSDGVTPVARGRTPTELALAGESPEHRELLLRSAEMPEGRWYSVTASPLCNPDRSVWGAVTVGRDMTRLKQVELALREQSAIVQLLEAVAATANQATTSRRAMQDCLRLICQHMKWAVGHVYMVDGAKLLPTDLWYLARRERFAAFREVTSRTHLTLGLDLPGRVLATGKPGWIEDVQKDPGFLRAKTGAPMGLHGGFALPVVAGEEVCAVLEFYAEARGVPDTRTLEIMQHVATQLARVAERERHAETVRNLSLTDELTSLNNRRGFFASAEPQLRIAARAGRTSLLLFIDMDGLKQINDQLGHEIGDQALCSLAKLLRATFRDSDVLARLGGDEFVVLLPDATSTDENRVVARLHEALAMHNIRESGAYVLAVSVGVTPFDPRQPVTLEQLLTRADALMYEQKRRRKTTPRPSVVMREQFEE